MALILSGATALAVPVRLCECGLHFAVGIRYEERCGRVALSASSPNVYDTYLNDGKLFNGNE